MSRDEITIQEKQKINAFWKSYLGTLPYEQQSGNESIPDAWAFGSTPEMADGLGKLVIAGKKTATCSLLWAYEFENEPLPQVGEFSILLDSSGNPYCLIKTTEIEIKPFNKVDAKFAYEEGEGDRSLAYWREEHWRAFAMECELIAKFPSKSMPLVCERFEVLYISPDRKA